MEITNLSLEAHRLVATFLQNIDLSVKVEGLNLGKLRLAIKEHLATPMKQIDKLVKKLLW